MSRSSFSSYCSWSEDSDYATFQPTVCPFDAPPIPMKKQIIPEREIVPVPRDSEDEHLYENLGRKCSTTVALYGQILRSALNKSNGKKQKKLIDSIGELFQLTTFERNSERLASIVEKKLDRMMEVDVHKFRQTAEKMSQLLQQGNQRKPPKLYTIKQKIRSIFIN